MSTVYKKTRELVKTVQQSAIFKHIYTIYFKLFCTRESEAELWGVTLNHNLYERTCIILRKKNSLVRCSLCALSIFSTGLRTSNVQWTSEINLERAAGSITVKYVYSKYFHRCKVKGIFFTYLNSSRSYSTKSRVL